MASPDDIKSATFAALDRHIRQASIAEIGGFRLSGQTITSYFGGGFVAGPGESWPQQNDLPMLPLLQVRTDELPYRPQALDGIALFKVFIGPDALPLNLPAANGDGWLLRSYPSLEGLSPLALPEEPQIRPFPVQWHLSESEGPQWEDAWDLYDMDPFNDLEDSTELFYDRYDRHTYTKVGGWPSYIQGSMGSEGYVFQIGSEVKPRWMWGDNGNGYFFLRDGVWFLHWDCY